MKANAAIKIAAMADKPAMPAAPATAITQTRPPWLSPVPYLFGGLAAMLGLIAFALLLLACSYWKLSDHDSGEKQRDFGEKVAGKVYEEKILVIMAGEEKPTFLATPVAIAFAATTPESSLSGGIVNKEGEEGQKWESGSYVSRGTVGSSSHEVNQ